MIKWLEDNPVGLTLAAVCGALLLISLALVVLRSLPPPSPSLDSDPGAGNGGLVLPEPVANEPLEKFVVITDRPVFNESRQPSLDLEIDESAIEEPVETEVDAPEVELAGVIITPTMKMATLKQKEGKESLVAFEGKPLEGNYGTWQVSRIEPRQVTLSSDSGQEMELQLQVHDMVIDEPPETTTPGGAASDEEVAREVAQAATRDSNDPMTRAEEIRQRIAERREELRRAAEAEEQDAQAKEQPTYQQAIQSMMGRNRQEETDNDEEQ